MTGSSAGSFTIRPLGLYLTIGPSCISVATLCISNILNLLYHISYEALHHAKAYPHGHASMFDINSSQTR